MKNKGRHLQREAGIGRCLIFTPGVAKADGRLPPLLVGQGLSPLEASDEQRCLDLLRTGDFRLLVIDATTSCESALRFLARARRAQPGVPAVVLVAGGHVAGAVQAMKAGASNCLEMPVQAERLSTVVASLCKRLADELNRGSIPLTRVERLVLRHVLEGRTNRQIAAALCRSRRTIEVHRRHIRHKLHVKRLTDLVSRALAAGLIEQPADPKDTCNSL